jgi:peptidoglycan/xylan/chitin deacetylase (PgdA/CDA1 family)
MFTVANMNLLKKIVAAIIWYSGAGRLGIKFRSPQRLIIAYHSISDFSGPYSHITISPKIFENHIVYLKEIGYHFVHFKDLLAYPDKKVVAIYFDDGFKSVLENAYSILKKEKVPATLFLTADYIDQKSDSGKYLSWQQARGMKDIFEFGSHSVTHPKLNKISIEEAKKEMAESKEKIERELTTVVTSFSYPKGRSSNNLEEIARNIGYILTTADARFHKVRPDPNDTLEIFKLKIIV